VPARLFLGPCQGVKLPPATYRPNAPVPDASNTLQAVGLNELVGGAWKGQRYASKIPKMSHLSCHSNNRFSSIA
jgi:hypothetical protein